MLLPTTYARVELRRVEHVAHHAARSRARRTRPAAAWPSRRSPGGRPRSRDTSRRARRSWAGTTPCCHQARGSPARRARCRPRRPRSPRRRSRTSAAAGASTGRPGEEADRDVQVLAHPQPAAAQRGHRAVRRVGGPPPRLRGAGDHRVGLGPVALDDPRAERADDGVMRLLARHQADAGLQRRLGDRWVEARGQCLYGVADHDR